MIRLITVVLFALLATGCVSRPGSGAGFAVSVAPSERVPALAAELTDLSGPAGAGEAEKIARIALFTAEKLRGNWRPIGPPLFNNLLVNMGYRDRGLCYEWTNDLLEPLEVLSLRHFDLHWGTSRWGDRAREHNALVISARGRPFSEGVVLDAWREGGRLVWLPVGADRKYVWRPLSREELEKHRPIARKPAPVGR